MSSPSIYEFKSAALRTRSVSFRTSPAPVVSICNAPAQDHAIESQPGAPDAHSLGCVRGICAAFLLEGGMALLAYGVWHLWRSTH